MKRTVKIILITGLLSVIGLLLVTEWVVESIFSDIINNNPDRAYDISYDDLDLHTFFKGVTFKSAKITPLHISDTTTTIHGTVEYIDISGIRWRELLFSKKANIRQLIFINPVFEISVVEVENSSKKKQSEKSMQVLFGDVLARGEIRSFKIENGSVEARQAVDSVLIAKVENLNLEAEDIETDSVQATRLIPFQVGSFHSSIDSAYILLNDHTTLRTGHIGFHERTSTFELNHLSLAFSRDRLEVSDIVGEQTDLIEADIKLLRISELDAQSNLYTDLDIRARSILIDGLVLKDLRDKNKVRPPDSEKPMFEGMVESIPIPFKIDSIIINNSSIFYSELAENKSKVGTAHFGGINGTIVGVTSIPEFQDQYQSFDANVEAVLNQNARVTVALEVPYERESFILHARIDPFHLGILNPTIMPLAGVEVTSGMAQKIDMKMNATRTQSENMLIVDYDSLGLAVLKDHDHDYKKKGIISSIANSSIRHTNLPDHKHYQSPEYTSYRNIYRGPFNFMWESAKEGMLYIVPTGAAGLLVGNPEKKAKKKQKKQLQ